MEHRPLTPQDEAYWTPEQIDAMFDRIEARIAAEKQAKAPVPPPSTSSPETPPRPRVGLRRRPRPR